MTLTCKVVGSPRPDVKWLRYVYIYCVPYNLRNLNTTVNLIIYTNRNTYTNLNTDTNLNTYTSEHRHKSEQV